MTISLNIRYTRRGIDMERSTVKVNTDVMRDKTVSLDRYAFCFGERLSALPPADIPLLAASDIAELFEEAAEDAVHRDKELAEGDAAAS